ncbi:MAG: protease inhibitor I42 family protein [Hamadaea sp.]|uniref:protease inhibitor I42 family protein n=1 Tax=Hamadaea sp. TaxID=2024425 RepID=UPI0017DA8B62|nr:protease inhibitor I42 family protein [Hamadaea sp.]NUR73914.1 protease inhibitor I42 family protein [Hamadaea sp.]NUT19611.1 protease inhibitor I42 family protein [Hamadaea sp.]
MRLRWLPVLPATVLALALSGCSSTEHAGVGVGSITIEKGQTLSIDLGKVNGSIGDSWYVVESGDRAILGEPDREYDSDCHGGEVGCGGTLSYEFKAVGVGKTKLVFQYCYRSGPSNCDTSSGRGPTTPQTIKVTVTK